MVVVSILRRKINNRYLSEVENMSDFIFKTEEGERELERAYSEGYEAGRTDERAKVLEEVMAIIKAKISEKEYPIETMVELTDLGGKVQQLNNSK